MTEGKNYEVESEHGVLYSYDSKMTGKTVTVKLTKTAWFGKMPKWELRTWKGDDPSSGVVIGFDDKLIELRDMLIKVCAEIGSEEEEY